MATFPMKFKPEGVGQTKKAIKGLNTGVKGLGSSLLKIGASVAVLRGVSKAVMGSVTAFQKQQDAVKRLNTVLKSTNHVAGLTSQELQDMASALQETTTFGDEAVMSAQSLMLTFTQVGKEVMPQAIESVLNMSEALNIGLKEQTLQLGKALNDPIKGIGALSRVGVQLTEDQKGLIKSFMEVNDVASAQKVILDELEVQFGGVAKASSTTFSGAIKQMKNSVGDMAEDFGELLEEPLTNLANKVKKWAEDVSDLIDFSKTIDWNATFDNITNNYSTIFGAVGEIGAVWATYVGNKFINGMGMFLNYMATDFISDFGETIAIAFANIGIAVRNMFRSLMNGIMRVVLDGILFLNDAMLGMVDPSGELAENVKKMFKTDEMPEMPMMDYMSFDPEQIDTFEEATEKTGEILSGLSSKIIETKKTTNPNNPEGSLLDGAVGLSKQEVNNQQKNLDKDSKNKTKKLKTDKKLAKEGLENLKKDFDDSAREFQAFTEFKKALKAREILMAIPSAVSKAYEAGLVPPGPFAMARASIYAGMAFASQMAQLKTIQKAEIGYDGLVTSPTMFLAGEGNKAERVSVTPLDAPNIKGPRGSSSGSPINISFSGNVMDEEYIKDHAIPMIRDAIRQGESFE